MATTADPSTAGSLRHIVGFLESSPVPVVVVDEAGVIAYVNAGAARLFDHSARDLVGHEVDLLVPGWARSGHLSARRRDGTEVPVDVSVNVTELADGRRWTVAGLTDISERIDAQARLAELSAAYLTLAHLNQAVVRAVDASWLYAETCRIAVEQGGYAGAFVAVADAGGPVVLLAREGRLGEYLDSLDIVLDPDDPRGRGPTAVALRENRSCFSSDFLHDDATAPWHEGAAREGIRASASLPLREDGAAVAALTIYSDHTGSFDQGVGDLFEQVADNVSHALDAFAATARLQRETTQRRDLMRRLVTAQETERARIAADIHDDSVQSLAAVELRLGLLKRRMRGTAADLVPMVEQVSHTVRAASEGLRHLLFELEPPPEGEGWSNALRATAEQVFEDHPELVWSVTCDDEVWLAEAERVQAMRIVKEALINVRKHADAGHVEVRVGRVDGGVEVAVTDDGVGLPQGVDPERLPARAGHRGVATMCDRATATGGWCRLERVPSGGTRLRFFVPSVPSA